jgi:hypothetical protein
MEIDSFDKIGRINDICVMLLKNYLDRFLNIIRPMGSAAPWFTGLKIQ